MIAFKGEWWQQPVNGREMLAREALARRGVAGSDLARRGRSEGVARKSHPSEGERKSVAWGTREGDRCVEMRWFSMM